MPQEVLSSEQSPEQDDYEDCLSKSVVINDKNYPKIIDWFKACLKLSQSLPPSEKDEYELNLIGNVKNALTDFFQKTELSLSTLIGIEKEITTLFQPLSPSSGNKKVQTSQDIASEQKAACTMTCPLMNPPCRDVEEAIETLYKKIAWLCAASIILLMLITIVMVALCWLRKCISCEMSAAFATCPGGEEEEEEEDENLYYDYPATLAYPMRVWLNPITGKKQICRKLIKRKMPTKPHVKGEKKENSECAKATQKNQDQQ